MNACIAAIADCAEKRGARVRGVFRGYVGLMEANYIPIGAEIAGLARRGGSFSRHPPATARSSRLSKKTATSGCLTPCGIDGLIVLGGGGSLQASGRTCRGGRAFDRHTLHHR